jgi:hypothetical protein
MQLHAVVEGLTHQLCMMGVSVSNPDRKTSYKATVTEIYRDFLHILYENVG